MIEYHCVNFSYGSKVILRDINLSIPDGQFLCLLGQSGCGKSTLLRLTAGLSTPTTGVVTINGATVTAPAKECAVVFQDYSLFPWMTTGKNLVLALHSAFPAKSKGDIRGIAESYLEMVGLAGCFDKLPGTLSGGMRQRAAIARALAVNSPVLLMDEPFGALDPLNRAMLQDLLLNLWENSGSKRTVLFVTHDVDEALFLSERIVVLGSSPGEVVADLRVPEKQYSSRQQLFHQPEIRKLQTELLELYRNETLRKLESNTLLANGSGI